MKKYISTFYLLILFISAKSQNVGIGTTTPHSSAALEILDTSRGILIPRITMVQRNNIQNPAEGLMVYQIDSAKGIWYFSSNKWKQLAYYDSIINSNQTFETTIGNSITNLDTVSRLMRYVGDGQEGDFNSSNFSGTLSGEHFFKNFTVPPNSTLSIERSNTTIIHVKDTCIITGVINGNGNIVPSFQETRDFMGATGNYSRCAGGQQSGYYYQLSWNFVPDGLCQLLGYYYPHNTEARWNGVSMTKNDMRIASFLGLKIHGCSSNFISWCPDYQICQGGAGLIIICKNLIFNGQIFLNGTYNQYAASGGGSIIISTDNKISNTGIINMQGGSGGGNGYFYFIEY